MATEHVLEQRGGRRVLLRFTDTHLRHQFTHVWRRLPGEARDAVYSQLGDGGALLVTDDNKANRPSNGYGQVARVCEGLRLFLDLFNLADVSDRYSRYIVAHELAHAALGHLPTPDNEFDLSPAAQLEVLRRVAPPPMTRTVPAEKVSHEDEADRQAAAWGFRKPTTLAARRHKTKADTRFSEWTKAR